MRTFTLCVVLVVVAAAGVEANPNGLGRTPPMGWNTWYVPRARPHIQARERMWWCLAAVGVQLA